jgi:hypothetical protein
MDNYIGTKLIKAEPINLVEAEEILHRKIKAGHENGYLVEYEDGYKSWSPKDTFEKAYRKNGELSFEMALSQVKQGKGMRLTQWKEDVVIRAQYPDEHSKMTAPYLYVESRFGRVPWKETMIEIFTENWEVVE